MHTRFRPLQVGLYIILLFSLLLGACRPKAAPTPAPTPAPGEAGFVPFQTQIASDSVRTATLTDIVSRVQTRPQQNDALKWDPAQMGQVVVEGGQIRTLENALARLLFSEGTVVRIASNTTLTVEKVPNNSVSVFTRLQLFVGTIWINLAAGDMEVNTPVGLASVRGSFLKVSVVPGNVAGQFTVSLQCLEGECTIQPTGHQKTTFTTGQTSHFFGDTSTGISSVPEVGEMSTDDVKEFIQTNPEAKFVEPTVQPLVFTSTPTSTLAHITGGGDEASATPSRTGTPRTPTRTPTQANAGTVQPTRTPTQPIVGTPRTPTRTPTQPIVGTVTRTPTQPIAGTPRTPTRTPTRAASTTPPPANTATHPPAASNTPQPPPTNTPVPPPSNTPGVIATATPPIVATP